MAPILLIIGPFRLYSGGLFLILSWLIASFVFWRHLKEEAIHEEKIFDSMFYMTFGALIGARIGYVILHWQLFVGNILKIPALWIAPGLWFYGGFLGMIVVALSISRRLKLRLSYIIDALARAIVASGAIASLGTMLEGSEVGNITQSPFHAIYIGHTGWRHPYGIYAMCLFISLFIARIYIEKLVVRYHKPYGTTGLCMFLLMSLGLFFLEFFKEAGVYIKGLSINQYVLIIIFAQSVALLWARLQAYVYIQPQQKALAKYVRSTYETFIKTFHR